MSFVEYKRLISLGDRVIIYLGYDELQPILVGEGLVHQTKYGAIKHNDLVGKEFGSKLKISKGFVHILHPTAELWTIALPHRTQILYNVDISEIIFNLDIHPGSIVVEAGTGSGSLSHSILRTIYPSGHLHTFDFHAGRVDEACEEFKVHGFDSQLVTIEQRDVCAEGFGLSGRCVDAVFLDLPSPWLAIPHAAQSLVEGGRICCFSPCMEQVRRTYDALLEHRFYDLTTVECLSRELNVRQSSLIVPDLGFRNRNKNIENVDVGDANFNICPIANSQENNNNIDDRNSDMVTNQDGICEVGSNVKTNEDKNVSLNYSKEDNDHIFDATTDEDPTESKKVKLTKINNNIYCKDCIESGDALKNNLDHKRKNENSDSEIAGKKLKLRENKKSNKLSDGGKGELSFVSLSPGLKITGHTGYLTFATLYPL